MPNKPSPAPVLRQKIKTLHGIEGGFDTDLPETENNQ